MLRDIIGELLKSLATDVAIGAERRLPKPLRVGCWIVLALAVAALALWLWWK